VKNTKAIRHFMVTKIIPENNQRFKIMIKAESKGTAIGKAISHDFGEGTIDSMDCRYEVEEWDMTGEMTRAYVDQ
tara:strand:- start:770 stop:994 length:225 start_codon:yes stop_codon:yes gene_type:complete